VIAIAAGVCLMAGAVAGRQEALAQGCSMCASALKGAADPLTRSFAASTVLLVSMPFTLFVSVAGYLWLKHHRRPADRPGMESGSHSDAEEALR